MVYGCAALVKLNPSYLSGSVFLLYLAPWVPSQVKRFDVLAPLAVLSVVAELFLAMAFWSPRLRRPAWVVGLGLHLGIVVLLSPSVGVQLTVFGMEMVALYTAFADYPGQRSLVILRRSTIIIAPDSRDVPELTLRSSIQPTLDHPPAGSGVPRSGGCDALCRAPHRRDAALTGATPRTCDSG